MTDTTPIDKYVGNYVALRDKLRAIEAEFDAKKKEYKDAMEHIGGILMEFLDKTGSESIRTVHGTCYTIERSSASVADGCAFMNYVLANQAFDLLERRANTTAVKEFVKEHKALPPGVNFSTIHQIGIRRSKGEPND